MKTTFGEFLAGPFVIDDGAYHIKGTHKPMYIKLNPCYGESKIGNSKFNAIDVKGVPFFVEDDEKIIAVSNVDIEYYDDEVK